MPFNFLIQLLIGIALNILAYLILPQPKREKPPATSDLPDPDVRSRSPDPGGVRQLDRHRPEHPCLRRQTEARVHGARMTEGSPRVTMKDCLRAGFCASGVREWLTLRGLDYRTFVRDGLPLTEVEAFNDGMAEQAAAKAKERHGE